jgi:hypothetical protein
MSRLDGILDTSRIGVFMSPFSRLPIDDQFLNPTGLLIVYYNNIIEYYIARNQIIDVYS